MGTAAIAAIAAPVAIDRPVTAQAVTAQAAPIAPVAIARHATAIGRLVPLTARPVTAIAPVATVRPVPVSSRFPSCPSGRERLG